MQNVEVTAPRLIVAAVTVCLRICSPPVRRPVCQLSPHAVESAHARRTKIRDHRYFRSLVFLGTGTSVGVPVIGCGCDTCQSTDPRNKRTRCGLVLGLPEGVLLVDTPTDLRWQLLRKKSAW